MTKNQKPCPLCGNPMHRQSPRCRECAKKDPLWRQRMSEARKGQPSYERTAAHKRAMSLAQKGKPKLALRGRKRPKHSRLMKQYWTAERREAKRQEMMKRNPLARYHGLSCKAAKRLVQAVGHCENCGHDGSEHRLSVHHKDRNKRNQDLTNLIVLCWKCHTEEHVAAGETGWSSYRRKRKMNPD